MKLLNLLQLTLLCLGLMSCNGEPMLSTEPQSTDSTINSNVPSAVSPGVDTSVPPVALPGVDTIVPPVVSPGVDTSVPTVPTVSLSQPVSMILPALATRLQGATFGITDGRFNPRAVARKGQALYIGNNMGQDSRIEIYDTRQKQAVTGISGFQLNGVNETYKAINDLTVHGNRLYVASLSSNRVDVYDITNELAPTIIMSLGTGNWSGNTQTNTLTHPLAVAANDDYVFTTDVNKQISVYQQQSVTAENHKKANKHAFFSLPDCKDVFCEVKLAVVGQQLLATFPNNKVFVYSISSIPASTTNVEPLAIQTNAARNVYQMPSGEVFIATNNGAVQRYTAAQMQLKAASAWPTPTQSFTATYGTDPTSGQVTKTELGAMVDLVAEPGMFAAAIKQDKSVVVADLTLVSARLSTAAMPSAPAIKFEQIASSAQQRLLQDDESFDSLTTNHQIAVNKQVNGRLEKYTSQQDKLTVTSYSLQDVNAVAVQFRLVGMSEWFELLQVDRVPALTSFTINANVPTEGRKYPLAATTAGGWKSIEFSGLDALGYFPDQMFETQVVSDTDAHLKKLNALKPKWVLTFGRYSTADGAWEKIKPVYARESLIMMTNFAYIIGSPEFKHVWFNFKTVYGQEFFDNNGPGAGDFDAARYERLYNEFLNRGRIRLGVTTIGGGLGGGDVLGVDTYVYYGHYYGSMGTVGHEFGHHWGAHSSAFARESVGLQPMSLQLQQMLSRNKALPYLDDNLNGLYQSAPGVLYNTVSNALRKPRLDSDTNVVERYFASNPL